MPSLNLKPTLSTFLSPAYTLGILEQPAIPTPMLDWNIQLVFPLPIHAGERGFFNFYPAFGLGRCALLGLLHLADLDKELPRIVHEGRLLETIQDILGAGKYAHIYVDYFYVEGTVHYLKEHFRHDLLVYESNSGSREFKGALYSTNHLFGSATMAFDQLETAFLSPLGRGKECLDPRYERDHLAAIQAAQNPKMFGKLDWPNIKTQLVCYLNSADLGDNPINHPLIVNFCRQESSRNSPAVFGVNVYAQLSEYFGRRCLQGSVEYDARITRLLWEHKKLMRIRLQRMASEGMPLDVEFLAAWDEIEKLAYGIHLRAFAARARGDSILLTTFPAEFDRIRSREESFLGALLKKF